MTELITFGRPFVLRRDRDISEVSGTGFVADGVLFPDGYAVIHWRGRWPVTTPHPDGIESILAIHDHGGRGDLHVLWADEVAAARREGLADIIEAFDVPAELCDTEAERAYLHRQILRALTGEHQRRADEKVVASPEEHCAAFADVVMPIVGQLMEQRDRAQATVGRAYALAACWKNAHGSSMFLVRAVGAELRDVLDESGATFDEVVHSVANVQASGLSGADDAATPAMTCSARYTGVLPVGECIRAAGHIAVTDHTDDRGRNWGDSLAEYPVDDSQAPPNQGPLAGVEVRDPCPYDVVCPLIPRSLMADHVREQHPDVTVASHVNGTSEWTKTGPDSANSQVNQGESADTPADSRGGIRGLLEHVGIDTRGRDITVAGRVVDAAEPHRLRLVDLDHPKARDFLADLIRSKWDSEGAPPDVDMAVDTVWSWLDETWEQVTHRPPAGTAGAAFAEARATNQRLNLRAQAAESALATIRRAVAQWSTNERGTYVPLHTIAAIAKAAGRDIENPRWLLHYQRIEQAEAAIERVRELHRPVEHRGRTICGECSAYDAEYDTTDGSPIGFEQCSTRGALSDTRLGGNDRQACPYCTGAPLFLRSELPAHVEAKHARVLAVLASGVSLDEQLGDPEARCRLPRETEARP